MTRLVWVFIVLLSLSSCKSRKVAANKPSRLSDLTLQEVIEKSNAHRIVPSEISAKAKVSFKIDKTEDAFKMNFRLYQDSLIWISATYFNIEVARFLMTPDTLKMVDRHNKRYYVGNYDFLLEKYETPFDFKALQAVLLGQTFDLGECEKTRIHNSRGNYILSGLRSTKRSDTISDLMQVFASWVDGETYLVSRLRIYEYKGKRSFSADFQDIRDNGEGLRIPHRIVYELTGEKKMEFISEYLRIGAAPGQTYPFSIDAKYEPIPIP